MSTTFAAFPVSFFGRKGSTCLLILLAVASYADEARIDALVSKRLAGIGQAANPPAQPERLLRRLYLQIIGRNPSVVEYEAFMAGPGKLTAKKRLLIDQLLASNEYVMHEFNFWSEMKNEPDNSNMKAFYFWEWFKQQLDENARFNEFVFKMLTAADGIYGGDGVAREFRQNGNFANWFADTMLYFHGTHITCAECHDHPFDSYTQKEYYQMTAFLRHDGHKREGAVDGPPITKVDFGKIRKQASDAAVYDGRTPALVNRFAFWFSKWAQPQNTQKAGVDHLPALYASEEADGEPGQLVRAQVIYGQQPTLRFSQALPVHTAVKKGQKQKIEPEQWAENDSRRAFAEWFTSVDNPRFTRVLANRLWKRVMGMGLIEPAGKIKATTKPSDPDLMQALVDLVREHDYRLKDIYRVLYNSEVFACESSSQTISYSKAMGFSGPISRRVSAEQMWDNLMVLRNPQVGEFAGEPRPDHPSRLHPYKAYYQRGFLDFDQEQASAYILKVGREAKAAGITALDYENRHIGHGGSKGAIPLREGLDTTRIERKFLRASELRVPELNNHFLAHFGQSTRKELFGSVREASSTQALLMINWAEKSLFVSDCGILKDVAASEGDDKIHTLYKGTLSRRPSAEELAIMNGLVEQFGTVAYRDILWVLVNSNEFRTIQ